MSPSKHHSRNGFLTKAGYALVAQRSLEGLEVDAMEVSRYVDYRVSVSGLELERNLYEFHSDSDIDEQYRRFQNGY